jgi:glutamine synthetase
MNIRPEIPSLKNFFYMSYEELEEHNLEAKRKQEERRSPEELEKYYVNYLAEEKRIKAVTICFTDIEGKLHMIDYDKKFLLTAYDNLTFDGSSVRGFSNVSESDLRLVPDWGSFRWLPADVFGSGKVFVFGLIQDRDGTPYPSDMRGVLKSYLAQIESEHGYYANVSVECEGFLFQGRNVEQEFHSRNGFNLVASGGYYNALPGDPLRDFIDTIAEAQRSVAFENEKDHPEVAPSQFELNYKYCDALIAADQLQLYKLISRQVAASMGMTACFLPKPIAGINGSGMHTNMSISKSGKNLFYEKGGEDGLSSLAWSFIDRLLYSANDLCLLLNSSVNAYRRLDPHYEAPNQIKSSAVDRTSMVRIPLGNEKSSRIEVRTVAPDANPYLTFYTLLRTGLEGPVNTETVDENRRTRTRFLPSNIYDAIAKCKASPWITEMMSEITKTKFIDRKIAAADRCPKELGVLVKTEEVVFHHEVTNQSLWAKF